MNDLFAIVPASAIILLIAIRKIVMPVKFNQEIIGTSIPTRSTIQRPCA